jgi:PAS domain S-box-containing protein
MNWSGESGFGLPVRIRTRLVGPAITLAVAFAFLQTQTLYQVPNAPSVMVLAVVFSAFHGGLASGLTSAAIAWAFTLLHFSDPGAYFHYSSESFARVAVWAVLMPLIALMVGVLKRRADISAKAAAEHAIAGARLNERNQAEAAQRRAAESALGNREGVFQQLFESMPDPVISINREGAIVRINSQAEQVFGYNREEMLGQPVEMLIPGRFRDRHVGLRGGYIAEPKVRPMGAGLDLYGRRKDGSEFAVEISLSPMETEEGLFAVSVVRDVTAQKETQQALKELSDELARSNTDLQQFAFAASHDLQEPLRAVAGCTQILQKRYADKLDARADELINEAVHGATRMQSLVNDLLAFSRVGSRGQPLGRVDAGRSLEDALHNLAVALRESAALVTHDPMPEVPADASQLALVFQNLVANAIKFRGERRPEIHVGAERAPGEWRFFVRDNGVGIEPQYFERIFLIFQRLHTRRESPGTGIGLALCKRIVERHGGRIWLESEAGKGSTFYFTIAERS